MANQTNNIQIKLIESQKFSDISEFRQPARLFIRWESYKTTSAKCRALDYLQHISDRMQIVFDFVPASFWQLLPVFQCRSGKILRVNFRRAHLVELEMIGQHYRKRATIDR